MDSPGVYAALADLVLIVHFLIVAFVVAGFAAILLGRRRDWPFVYQRWFRLAHLAAIIIIVLQAWLGRLCPLTVWEQQLRSLAGQAAYGESFVQHWLHRLLFFDAPLWVFGLLYTAFGAAVVYCWLADRERLSG